MDAIIICIGDEILSGDITDLNSTWLAKNLTELGTVVKRIEVIPDDVAVIVDAVKNAKNDKVIITGGLGPTHDDVTRQAVAAAFGLKLVRDPEAIKVVEASAARHGRPAPRPQSYVMADIPEGSEVIPNPVGAAPGFIIDGRVFTFPGVPSEMKAMFELVKGRFEGKKLFVDWLITRRPESDIVPALNEAVKKFPGVTFGSYPSDVVKIKMKSYDRGQMNMAKEWLTGHILQAKDISGIDKNYVINFIYGVSFMDIKKSAMIAVKDCMGVKPGEKVLIVTDTERDFIGIPLFEAALELGSEAIYMEMKPRTRSGEEPPEVIAKAMLHSDVVIAPTKFSLTHTRARKVACANGARIATIPLTEGSNELIREMFATGGMTADYFRMRDKIDSLYKQQKGTKTAHITTMLGTDITVDFAGREWHMDTGLALNPGDFTNLPGGELFIAPTGANGRLVIDGSFGDYGLLDTPLELTIKDGMVIEARGSHADDLMVLFNSLGPDARHIAELGIGMNPSARLWGILLEDEKVGNTIHMALGNDCSFGGSCTVEIHYDGIVTNPTVHIDGRPLNIAEYL